MSVFRPSLVLMFGVAGVVASCNETSSASGSMPTGTGLTCATTKSAADSAALSSALAGATSGTCVVLSAASYAGPLKVPAGVSLVAQTGARATVTGGTAQDPAVSLGEGGGLVGVDVIDPGGVGIAVRGANAILSNITVTGAKNAALAVLCRDSATPGCASGKVVLTDVTLTKSTMGLWVSGAHVAWTRGASNSHASTSLTAAAGVIAQDGAKLELEGVVVEKNQGVGVLVDGATTTASLKNATISENAERGVWAQRIAGTLDSPALKIEGSEISKNRIVGVGAVESRGIIIVSGRIADTVAAPLVTNLESTEQIGDGLGLFTGSGDLKIEGLTFASNARAAGVIDGSDRGIIIVSGKVGPGPSGLKFVVQNTKGADVQIPEADRSVVSKPLGVSAPKLALPPVL